MSTSLRARTSSPWSSTSRTGPDTLFSVYTDKVEESFNEELIDFILEAQIEIDYSFGKGEYEVIFNVKDEFSNQTKSISVKFNLAK